MQISDRYLARQVFTGTIMAVVLLSVVLIMGMLYKEIRELLVQYQAPPKLVAQFMLYSMPYPLMFALPLGFLTTVLLTFGRLSTQNELVGFRTSGMSLVRLTLPIFILGALFSVLCWFLSGYMSPMAKLNSRKLIDVALKQDPVSLLASNTETKLPGFQLYVTDKKGRSLEGFHLYHLSSEEEGEHPKTYVYAKSVDLRVDKQQSQFVLSFQDAFIEEFPRNQGETSKFITASTAEPWPLAFPTQAIPNKVSYRTNTNLVKGLANNEDSAEKQSIVTEIQKRHALSLACFAFAFIGIPFGITSQRRETASGLVVAIVIALLYFVALLLAENFEENPMLCSIMMWLPNLVCFVLGGYMLRKSSRR